MSIYGATTIDAPRFDDVARDYDALLVLSFGGPEGPDEVMPFLERVTRGRNVPKERLAEVAEHYLHFGGVSPINAQTRALIAALEAELAAHGPRLPIYWGNRNWHPFVTDTVRQMRDDGVRRALVFVTSAFSSYSGCRQYREDVIHAVEAVRDCAPTFDKIRVFYNHPGFIEPMIELTKLALDQIPPERRSRAVLLFSAHSIPLSMARGCAYEAQIREASQLIADGVGRSDPRIVYQSRSGPPHVPWLEPDICDVLDELAAEGTRDVVAVPVGFISDHMEVLFDLDTEAKERAHALGINFVRAATVGTHPAFIRMIRELIVERMTERPVRRALGRRGPTHDICPLMCCLRGDERLARSQSALPVAGA